jgi:hypothetical protein
VDVGYLDFDVDGELLGIGVEVVDEVVGAAEHLDVAHVGFDFEGLEVTVDGEGGKVQGVEGWQLHFRYALGQEGRQGLQLLEDAFVVLRWYVRALTHAHTRCCNAYHFITMLQANGLRLIARLAGRSRSSSSASPSPRTANRLANPSVRGIDPAPRTVTYGKSCALAMT